MAEDAADGEPLAAIGALLEVMARLRDPVSGCPWDRAQDFASIAPYTLEEAYEVADAIARADPAGLRDELGDLLFQVVFHARLAEERQWFNFAAVAAAIRDKLIRRHPHVFAGAAAGSPTEQNRHWEELKAEERAQAARRTASADVSALATVPIALPALMRAAKLGRRASRVGFDWPDRVGVKAKIHEELAELDAAVAQQQAATQQSSAETREAQPTAAVSEEFGDLLFALVNLGRHLNVEPEAALRAANDKFERRFRHMESLAAIRGVDVRSLTLAAWEELWDEAKRVVAPVLPAADANI